MKFTQVVGPVAALLSAASAAEVTVTTVVDEFVTYCPGPTVIPWRNVTYTVTAETYLTIDNCPCTITTTLPAPGPTSQLPQPEPQPQPEPAPEPAPEPQPEPAPEPETPTQVPEEPVPVPTTGAAADKAQAGFGALIIAGVAALMI